VIQAGTFSYFSTDLDIRSAQKAAVALRDGEAVLVDVGVARRRPFVNTSSTGIYVDLVQAREGSGWRTRRARRPPRSSRYFSYCDVVDRTSQSWTAAAVVYDCISLVTAGTSRRAWRPPTGPQPRHPDHRGRNAGQDPPVCCGRDRDARVAVRLGGLPRICRYRAGLGVHRGEVATAESSIRHAKRERGLLVYRQAAQ